MALSLKQNINKRIRDIAQVIEHLPNNFEVLDSIPSAIKNQKIYPCGFTPNAGKMYSNLLLSEFF
jgi:hypothetical protein